MSTFSFPFEINEKVTFKYHAEQTEPAYTGRIIGFAVTEDRTTAMILRSNENSIAHEIDFDLIKAV